jgi:hypothetical protein
MDFPWLSDALLQSPDLDAQEELLAAFGTARTARPPMAVCMRCTDSVHRIHVAERGAPKFLHGR